MTKHEEEVIAAEAEWEGQRKVHLEDSVVMNLVLLPRVDTYLNADQEPPDELTSEVSHRMLRMVRNAPRAHAHIMVLEDRVASLERQIADMILSDVPGFESGGE